MRLICHYFITSSFSYKITNSQKRKKNTYFASFLGLLVRVMSVRIRACVALPYVRTKSREPPEWRRTLGHVKAHELASTQLYLHLKEGSEHRFFMVSVNIFPLWSILLIHLLSSVNVFLSLFKWSSHSTHFICPFSHSRRPIIIFNQQK